VERTALRTVSEAEEEAVSVDLGASVLSRVFHCRPGSFLLRVSSTLVGVILEVEAEASIAAKRGSRA
jgi:hypothetical protein